MPRFPSFLALLLGTLLALGAGPVHAQAQQRGYAPEDLRTLSQPDQVRVISLEYSEQSRGRRIPDDQLRFYLDQVNRSNWGFSRIRQDIATSLGQQGGGNPGQGPGPLPGPGGSVLCESSNNRYRECATGFRGRVVLTENVSRTRCVEGQNWGSRPGSVWVDAGCSGRFAGVAEPGQGASGTIRCESDQGRARTCPTGFPGSASLVRQLSSTPCIRGQNWGQRRGSVWVSGGCRAEFRAAPGGWNQGPGGNAGDYSVTCNSNDQRRSTCAWTDQRPPVMLQQLSSDPCREGQTWGYTGNAVWVDRGCRARFGVRR